MSNTENTSEAQELPPPAQIVEVDSKPPAQIIQVESIAPEPIVMNSSINLVHDWYRLLNSAPFQMYCSEITGNDTSNVEEWILLYVENEITTHGEDGLFECFSKWHSDKGYWKNETVYGDFIEGD
jgi:hypothetical protein